MHYNITIVAWVYRQDCITSCFLNAQVINIKRIKRGLKYYIKIV